MVKIDRWFLIGGVIAAAGLVVATLRRYPALLDDPGAAVFLSLLVAAFGVAVAGAFIGTPGSRPLWARWWARWRRLGIMWGLAVGAMWVVEMLVANLAYGRGSWLLLPYFGAILAAVVLNGTAAALAVYRSGHFVAGPLVGAWTGLIGGIIGLCTMTLLALVAMPVLRDDPQNIKEFASKEDFAAAIAGDFVAAGIMHVVAVGLLAGAAFGTLGALVALASRRSLGFGSGRVG
jgi:hypothetical protein